jgi:DNA-binding transcriptional ArsR family regulator
LTASRFDDRTSAWTALVTPTRRAIFERLLEQPQTVHALAKRLPVSRPAVSQHLKVLSDAGLVVAWPLYLERYAALL